MRAVLLDRGRLPTAAPEQLADWTFAIARTDRLTQVIA